MSLTMRAYLKRAVAVTLLPFALLAATTPPAHAAAPNVACSDTLTQDTVLSADLYCPGTGVTVNPGVTFDLGGHTYSSNNAGDRYTMVWGTLGGPGAQIINGTLKDWRQIDVSSTNTEFRNVRLQNSIIFAMGTATVVSSRLSNSSVVGFSTKFIVDRSTVENTTLDGENNTIAIKRSTVRDSRFSPVDNDTLNISGSTLTRTQIPCESDLSILNSTVSGVTSGPAVWMQSNDCKVVVSGSTFQNNAGAIDARLDGQPANATVTVRSSHFVNNGNAIVADQINLTNSTFTRNATAVTIANAGASAVSGSTFTRNTRDGLHTDAAGLRLRDNTAVNNGDYGLYAPGAVDLGGNVARGNQTTDCVGVTCSAG